MQRSKDSCFDDSGFDHSVNRFVPDPLYWAGNHITRAGQTAVRHKVKEFRVFCLTRGTALGLIGEMERLERMNQASCERESGSGWQ